MSRVLQLFNDQFDILNTRTMFDRSGVQAFGLDLSVQTEILNKMIRYITNMRVRGRSAMLPFQKGILILTSLSLKSLYQHLSEIFGSENIKYILTYRLNQDVLDNFFSFIRGVGRGHDHPTALEVKYRLQWYILGKHAMEALSDGFNTENNLNNKSLINASDLKKGEAIESDIHKEREETIMVDAMSKHRTYMKIQMFLMTVVPRVLTKTWWKSRMRTLLKAKKKMFV